MEIKTDLDTINYYLQFKHIVEQFVEAMEDKDLSSDLWLALDDILEQSREALKDA